MLMSLVRQFKRKGKEFVGKCIGNSFLKLPVKAVALKYRQSALILSLCILNPELGDCLKNYFF